MKNFDIGGEKDIIICLPYLRDFLALAKSPSMAVAAEKLHKSPSAVTHAISNLEKILNVSLFKRHARGVEITEAGSMLKKRSLAIYHEISLAHKDMCKHCHGDNVCSFRIIESLLLNSTFIVLLTSLYENSSITLSAQNIGLTQSAASMAIARSEQALGCKIIQHKSKQATFTNIGDKILLRCTRIMAEFRYFLIEFYSQQARIIIGVLPLARSILLPSAIVEMKKKYPNVCFATIESPYKDLIQGVIRGDIDFIVGATHLAAEHSELTSESMFKDKLSIIVKKGHPLQNKSVSIKDILDYDWVLPHSQMPERKIFENYLKKQQIAIPTPVVETADITILRGLLYNSDMITAAFRHQLYNALKEGELAVLPIELSETYKHIKLIYRGSYIHISAILEFMDIIRNTAHSLFNV